MFATYLMSSLGTIARPAIPGNIVKHLICCEKIGHGAAARDVPIGAGTVAVACRRPWKPIQLFHAIAIGEREPTNLNLIGQGCRRQPNSRASARFGTPNRDVIAGAGGNPRTEAVVELQAARCQCWVWKIIS